MIAARQQFEAVAYVRIGVGLRQNSAAACDHRIRSQNDGWSPLPSPDYRVRLGIGQSQAVCLRRFVPVDGFVDCRPENRVWDDSDLSEQRLAPRTFAPQNERHGLT